MDLLAGSKRCDFDGDGGAPGSVAPSNSHFANLLIGRRIGSLPNGPAPHWPFRRASLADGGIPCPRMEAELNQRMEVELNHLISLPGRSSRTMHRLRPRLRSSSTGTPTSSPASVVIGRIGWSRRPIG